MRIVSVNCGLPREVQWKGTAIRTSIYKQPVEGRIALRRLNLDGDGQSDLTVHGGKDKAVYCYPLEHYAFWKDQLPGFELPFGVFGENFTVEGLSEETVHLGERFGVGSAEVVVSQPRMPCYKLGIRFQRDDIIQRFLESGRSGFYLSVAREGEVGAGDEIVPVSSTRSGVTIADILRLYLAKRFSEEDGALVGRALDVEGFAGGWKDYFAEKLARLGA